VSAAVKPNAGNDLFPALSSLALASRLPRLDTFVCHRHVTAGGHDAIIEGAAVVRIAVGNDVGVSLERHRRVVTKPRGDLDHVAPFRDPERGSVVPKVVGASEVDPSRLDGSGEAAALQFR
jgi:hypothetical protein